MKRKIVYIIIMSICAILVLAFLLKNHYDISKHNYAMDLFSEITRLTEIPEDNFKEINTKFLELETSYKDTEAYPLAVDYMKRAHALKEQAIRIKSGWANYSFEENKKPVTSLHIGDSEELIAQLGDSYERTKVESSLGDQTHYQSSGYSRYEYIIAQNGKIIYLQSKK